MKKVRSCIPFAQSEFRRGKGTEGVGVLCPAFPVLRPPVQSFRGGVFEAGEEKTDAIQQHTQADGACGTRDIPEDEPLGAPGEMQDMEADARAILYACTVGGG